jgi:hypothetical protein
VIEAAARHHDEMLLSSIPSQYDNQHYGIVRS